MDQYLTRIGKELPEEEVTVLIEPMEIEDASKAVSCILKNERGRQGIERGNERKEERMKRNPIGKDDDYTTIQKHFRAYADRKIVYDMRLEEMKFLGMLPEDSDEDSEEIKKYKLPDGMRPEKKLDKQVAKIRERRKGIQKRNANKMEQEKNDLKDNLRKKESPDIRDKMLYERRQWITDFYEDHEGRNLPADVEEFYERTNVGKPLSPEEEELKKKAEQEKKKLEKKAKENLKKGKLTAQQQFVHDRIMMGTSASLALKEIQENIGEFTNSWAVKDENDNYDQGPDKKIIEQELMPEIEEEIEQEVDTLIQFELQNLYSELKIKKPPRKKKNKKNGRRGRNGKDDKGKKDKKRKKIPGAKRVGNRHPNDLMGDLVDCGIAKKLKEAKMEDFKGDHNFIRGILEQQESNNYQLDPSNAQLRQVCSEFIAIPLGTGLNIENEDRTFFFYGPPGTGKTLMVRAIAHETRSIILDISPEIVSENFKNKALREKILYTVFTVAREFQPAIIVINEVEHFFPGKKKKKKKKGEIPVGSCKKAKKDLLKQIRKNITKEDKVVVIACTNRPLSCNQKDIKKIFTKKFHFPAPDYPTRCLLFKDLVEKAGGKLEEEFQINLLGQLLKGYTPGGVSFYLN